MARISVSHFRPSALSRCASRHIAQNFNRRTIATSWLRKVKEGEDAWAERSAKIEAGELPHVWDVLEERGYIKDVAGSKDRVKEIIRIKRIGAYVGIDPTADSMHIGHLLPFMPLFWMWFHGHPAITLLGGATARIGDPTGRLTDREQMSNSEISKNIAKLHYQLTRLWYNVHQLRDKYGYQEDWAAKHHLLNNNVWIGKLTIYDFVKRLARLTRLGPMLSRDTVKRKLNDGDGMSLGEFIYPMLQGWDFWHMYNKYNVQLQIGGSDQYGNIVAGIDSLKLIRDSEEAPHARMPSGWQHEPVGFTTPLLTDSAGNKFGKSAGNAIWLDQFKTSAFDLYGYFMRRSDDEVEDLLKLFTFMPLSKISEVMTEHRQDPSQRVAQHHLAFDVLSLVHGSQTALEEAQQHSFRFGGKLPQIVKDPALSSGIVTPNNAPRIDIKLPRSVLELSPAKILFAIGLASSASEGQRLVKQQGAYVAAQPGKETTLMPGNLAWTPMKMWFPEETAKFLIGDNLLIFRKGKHNVRIVELVSDADWKLSGEIYPGQPYTGKIRRLKEQLRAEVEEAGEVLTPQQVNKRLSDMALSEPLTVANNSDIELPNKVEVRQRRKEDKAAKPKP